MSMDGCLQNSESESEVSFHEDCTFRVWGLGDVTHDDPLIGELIVDVTLRFLDTFSEVGDNDRKPGIRAWEGCLDTQRYTSCISFH